MRFNISKSERVVDSITDNPSSHQLFVSTTIGRFFAVFLLGVCTAGFAESESNKGTKEFSHEQKQELADHATHILGGNANVISRWSGNIALALISAKTDRGRETLNRVVSEISDLTGLPYAFIESGFISPQAYLEKLDGNRPYDFALCVAGEQANCANLIVVVSDIATVAKLATAIPLRDVYQRSVTNVSNGSPLCFFAPFVDGGMNIRQAFVYVRDDLDDEMLRTCIQEEVYQAFGLFNDAGGSDWFSFNNRVEPKDITPMDKLLLETLYSDEFRPGVPAFVVVRKFLNSLPGGQ